MLKNDLSEEIASYGWDDPVSQSLISEIESIISEYDTKINACLRKIQEIDAEMTKDVENALAAAAKYFK